LEIGEAIGVEAHAVVVPAVVSLRLILLLISIISHEVVLEEVVIIGVLDRSTGATHTEIRSRSVIVSLVCLLIQLLNCV
jgi:hypothetical protein